MTTLGSVPPVVQCRSHRPVADEVGLLGDEPRESLPLSRTDPLLRLNAVCPYYTMYPLEFPWRILASAKHGEWVLDPFCGRGTTLFAARLHGLGAAGIDVNPVAVALARAKLVQVTATSVVRRCRQLLQSGYEPQEVPGGEFWGGCFHQSTLVELCRLRELLIQAPDRPTTVALRAILLGVLHGPLRKGAPSYLSNQMPRTYATKPSAAVRFWMTRQLRPPRIDVLDVVERRARFTLQALPAPVSGVVRLADSATEVGRLRQRFSRVVTSPPYYGMRTYLADQWLRSWFLGGPPDVTYRYTGQLRQDSERIFVEGLATVWRACANRCLPGAQLVVRFGALPSRAKDPVALLRRSLEETETGWRIESVVPAGMPTRGSRQADHMVAAGDYVEEIDCYASLAR